MTNGLVQTFIAFFVYVIISLLFGDFDIGTSVLFLLIFFIFTLLIEAFRKRKKP